MEVERSSQNRFQLAVLERGWSARPLLIAQLFRTWILVLRKGNALFVVVNLLLKFVNSTSAHHILRRQTIAVQHENVARFGQRQREMFSIRRRYFHR